MISRTFRSGDAILAVLMIAALAAAQEKPVKTQPSTAPPAIERNREEEDKLAKLFERMRVEANTTRLKRVGHRASLEQEVCTIALTGTLPKYPSANIFVFYKTENPDSPAPELSKIAAFNNLHPKYNPSYARYSVAVWTVHDSLSDRPTYWVGIQVLWKAGMEFLDYHFTDDLYYRNDWKKSIAASCRNK